LNRIRICQLKEARMEFFSLKSMVLFGGFTAIAILSFFVGWLLGRKEGERKDD